MSFKKGLNRDVIKYMAMFTMCLNHFAVVFLSPGTTLYQVFVNIGYFTAITMCYFLVEGYSYTHSKTNYALRLLLFALISQAPYVLAFGYPQLNMLFTLLLCFFVLMVIERVQNPILQAMILFLLVFISLFTDWALMAPVFTILFAKCKKDKRKFAGAFAISFLLFFCFNLLNYAFIYPFPKAIASSFFSGLGIIVSGIVILFFYNGQRALHGKTFSKWFFYLFYPVHITLLLLIKMWL